MSSADSDTTGLPWMEVTVGDPIRVSLSRHDDVTAWDGPHLPRLVITHRRKDLFPRMQSNAARYRNGDTITYTSKYKFALCEEWYPLFAIL